MDEDKSLRPTYKKVDINKYRPEPIKEEIAEAPWFQNLATAMLGINLDGIPIEKVEQFQQSIGRLAHGLHSSIPMRCTGDACPFLDKCPYTTSELEYPEGDSCPAEGFLIMQFAGLYAQEYNVDADASFVVRMLVMELAELDVYERRLNLFLGAPDQIGFVEENVVGFDTETNSPIIQKQVSKFFDVKERIKNRRMQIHKELVGTPKELVKKRAVLKQRGDDDHSIKTSRAREDFERLISIGEDTD